MRFGGRTHSRDGLKRLALLTVCALAIVPVLSSALQPADANGDTRSLRIKNTHNGESIDVVFKRDGRYDQEGLKKYNWFLRDWRTNEPTEMDPRLLDLVWEVYRDLGGNEPLQLVSGFRSRQTNSFLRSRSAGVAKESQHTRGKAMDFFVPGVALSRIRERGMLRQRGGVGFYPTSGSPFVHLDVGNVRAWPRMTRDQLARLFPDGNTIHLPADGKPLAGYETTLARLGRDGKRGETVLAYAGNSDKQPVESQGGSATNILANLFGAGKSDDEDEDDKKIVSSTQRPVAARAVPPPPTLGVAARDTVGKEPVAAPASDATDTPRAVASPVARPLPRPIVTASLQPPTLGVAEDGAAPIPAPLPRPATSAISRLIPLPLERPREAVGQRPQDELSIAALQTDGEPVAALAPLAARLRDKAGLAAIARLDQPAGAPATGLETQGEQVLALAPLAARLRDEVAKAVLAKLDYRRLDRRTLTPTPMVETAPMTPPSVGNLELTMGPAMLATQFGRRPTPTLSAFGGPAIRAKRPSTI